MIGTDLLDLAGRRDDVTYYINSTGEIAMTRCGPVVRRLAICGTLAVVGWAVAVVCTPVFCEWWLRRQP